MKKHFNLNFLRYILSRMHNLRINLGITPFREIGNCTDGVQLLEARIKTPLASRREIICLPKDEMIYNYVKNYGQWGLEEALVLANLARQEDDVTVLDLGAHAGLVSRTLLKLLSDQDVRLILVDPLKINLISQIYNLKSFTKNIQYCTFALTSTTGKMHFTFDRNNIGASHAHEVELDQQGLFRVEVQGMSPYDFEQGYLDSNTKFIIKSDLEGNDANILSSFSEAFWEKVVGGIIEVEPKHKVSTKHMHQLSKHLRDFTLYWSDTSRGEISPEDLEDYWNNDKNHVRNLIIARKSQ